MGLKGKEELDRIQGLTKWVPQPGRITRTIVNENIERSLRRMNVSSLDVGLMSERWLGKIQPSSTELGTLSLLKYMNMIETWSGWNLFQHLLSTLRRIAQKHNVSIANVATNYILAKTTGPLSVLDLE